ncbi:MAG: hypothetical protein ACMG6H_04665, partial [Acidobacteriota bacterium]
LGAECHQSHPYFAPKGAEIDLRNRYYKYLAPNGAKLGQRVNRCPTNFSLSMILIVAGRATN